MCGICGIVVPQRFTIFKVNHKNFYVLEHKNMLFFNNDFPKLMKTPPTFVA